MPTLPRSAKPPTAWTPSDLRAFNIHILLEDTQTFFGTAAGDMPVPPSVSRVIWDNVHAPVACAGEKPLEKTEKLFFAYMEDLDAVRDRVSMSVPVPPGEDEDSPSSPIVDFAVFLLSMLDYDDPPRVLHTRTELPFRICGSEVEAIADVTLVERGPLGRDRCVVLIVKEDKRSGSPSDDDPEPHLIVQAIAAFTHNARSLSSLPSRPSTSHEHTVPALTFSLTGPTATFYKIPVTRALASAVEEGVCPEEGVVVRKCVVRPEEGVGSLDDRRTLLKCLESFKGFVVAPTGLS